MGSGVQVLVIDDSDLARELMVSLLHNAGIICQTLPSAIGATQMILRRNISVVVTDVNMPTIPGNNLVNMLRSNPKTSHVKVALVSDLGRDTLYQIAREVRADGVVEKERMDRDLVPLVRKLIRAHKHNTSPMSARQMAPDFAFDEASATARKKS